MRSTGLRTIVDARAAANFSGLVFSAPARCRAKLRAMRQASDSLRSLQLWPEAVLDRARARAISSEMATSFANLRTNMACHLFGRVPGYTPNAATQREIDRIFEIWREALDDSGGPFLFGRFSIADAMFFPVRTRFRTYDVAIPDELSGYVRALDALPAVRALHGDVPSAVEILM